MLLAHSLVVFLCLSTFLRTFVYGFFALFPEHSSGRCILVIHFARCLLVFCGFSHRELAIKFATLVTVSVTSTIFSVLAIPILKAGIFNIMDGIINIICVLLMFKVHEGIYERICCCHGLLVVKENCWQ